MDTCLLLRETSKTLSHSQHLYRKRDQILHETQSLEQEKFRMQEREQCLQQAQLLQQRLLWLQEEELRTQALAAKERKQNINKNCAIRTNNCSPSNNTSTTVSRTGKPSKKIGRLWNPGPKRPSKPIWPSRLDEDQTTFQDTRMNNRVT